MGRFGNIDGRQAYRTTEAEGQVPQLGDMFRGLWGKTEPLRKAFSPEAEYGKDSRYKNKMYDTNPAEESLETLSDTKGEQGLATTSEGGKSPVSDFGAAYKAATDSGETFFTFGGKPFFSGNAPKEWVAAWEKDEWHPGHIAAYQDWSNRIPEERVNEVMQTNEAGIPVAQPVGTPSSETGAPASVPAGVYGETEWLSQSGGEGRDLSGLERFQADLDEQRGEQGFSVRDPQSPGPRGPQWLSPGGGEAAAPWTASGSEGFNSAIPRMDPVDGSYHQPDLRAWGEEGAGQFKLDHPILGGAADFLGGLTDFGIGDAEQAWKDAPYKYTQAPGMGYADALTSAAMVPLNALAELTGFRARWPGKFNTSKTLKRNAELAMESGGGALDEVAEAAARRWPRRRFVDAQRAAGDKASASANAWRDLPGVRAAMEEEAAYIAQQAANSARAAGKANAWRNLPGVSGVRGY